MRHEIDKKFFESNISKSLPQYIGNSKPIHWPLEFWYLYFNDRGEPLSEDERGADVLLGNPPYERIHVLRNRDSAYVEFTRSEFKVDLAIIFIERGFQLLKSSGEFGFIVTVKFIQTDYGHGIRHLLTSQKAIREIVDFGDKQVFDDVITYTVLIFLNKRSNSTYKYTLIKNLFKTREQMRTISDNPEFDSPNEIIIFGNESSQTSDEWMFIGKNEESIFKRF